MTVHALKRALLVAHEIRPKFDSGELAILHGANYELNEPLKAMGMAVAFDRNRANFRGIAEEGRAIRRRRECLGCGRRYTTFERAEEVPLLVAKRSGEEEPFLREKITAGLYSAFKNRPVTDAEIEQWADEIDS